MINGVQLLTFMAACAYMGIGAIVGFVAAMFIVPSICVVHPLVLMLWDKRRMAADARKTTRAATKILVEKMHEIDLQATKEVLMRHKEEDIAAGIPLPPPNVWGKR